MKKIIFIITFVFINSLFFIKNIKPVNIEKIGINLKRDELGIIFLKLEDSNSLLISLNNKNILYIIDYKNGKDLNKNINKFGINIDYIIMDKYYNVDIKATKIINKVMVLNNINFNNNRLSYNGKTFCINSDFNCDFIYYTKDYLINNENAVLFYSEEIEDKIIDNTYNRWIDKYEITKDAYTILKINEKYDVYDFMK